MRTQSPIPPIRNASNQLCKDPIEKVEVLANVFAENFDNINASFISDCHGPPSFEEFSLISERSIITAINGMKMSSSHGPDEIPMSFLKGAALGLAEPLNILFNYCFLNSTFPKLWRKARVIPIFKKGNPSDPRNYRPVSITSPFPKVMEKIITQHIIKIMLESDLLCDCQHGFLPGRSAIINLLSSMNDISNALEKGNPIDAIYLDFSRAFDKVHHYSLGTQLLKLSFPPVIIRFISTFIRERSQFVSLGDINSLEFPVRSGVVQGTILSSTLFTIFVTLLPEGICSSSLNIFADDVKLLHEATKENGTSLQSDLNGIVKWSHTNLLPISMNKSVVMHMGKNNEDRSYFIDNSLMKSVNVIRDLGITYDTKLSFSLYLSEIVSRAHRRAFMLRHCINKCDNEHKVKAFNVYVRPILEYGSAIWNPSLIRDIRLVESVQKRFTKYLHGMYHKTYEERLEALGMVSLERRRMVNDLCLMYKIINKLVFVSDMHPLITMQPNTVTRNNGQRIFIPMARNNKRFHFFTLRAARWWNCLPESVVSATSITQFKRLLYGLDLRSNLTVFQF